MIKDYGSRHPDWVLAKNHPYTTHDAEFDRKLADAIEWLRQSQQWRGETICRHKYTRADGTKSECPYFYRIIMGEEK